MLLIKPFLLRAKHQKSQVSAGFQLAHSPRNGSLGLGESGGFPCEAWGGLEGKAGLKRVSFREVPQGSLYFQHDAPPFLRHGESEVPQTLLRVCVPYPVVLEGLEAL